MVQKKRNYSKDLYKEENVRLLILIERYQQGDKEVINEIIEISEELIKSVFKSINSRYGYKLVMLAEDMSQEGLMGLLEACERYDIKYDVKPTTYIYNVCYKYMQRLARSFVKRAVPVKKYNGFDGNDNDMDFIPEEYVDPLARISLERGMENMLDILSPSERTVIKLKFWYSSLKNKDIGLIMGINSRTVARRFKSAKQKMLDRFPNFRSDFVE